MEGAVHSSQLDSASQFYPAQFASTLQLQIGNVRNDGERLNLNSMDGEDQQDMLDRYFSAEGDLNDGSNNELDFSERSLPNYMRNTKSREIQINEGKKVHKSTYKLMSP
jgi:hypothetical protein